MATPELMIDDVIGGDWFFAGITAKNVNRWLKENGKAKEILVRINSPGGSVFEGHSIYSALHKSDARVIVEVEGLAASAASVIAMAGDEIRVSKGAMIMIHESWGVTQGPAEDHIKAAELLRKINDEMADIYSARTKQTRERCLELMAEETWMGASEAKELGFCDAIIPAKGKPDQKAKSNAATAMLAAYKRAPSALTTAFAAPPAQNARFSAHSPLGEFASPNAFTARLGDR